MIDLRVEFLRLEDEASWSIKREKINDKREVEYYIHPNH